MIAPTDAMLTASSVGFFLSLLPAIRDSFRGRTTITLWASVPTTIFLLNTAAALFWLGQVFAGVTTLAVAACWATLAGWRWAEDV